MLKKKLYFIAGFLSIIIYGYAQQPKQYTYKITGSYPHDNNAYTQGLFFHRGVLYESVGQYGYSSLRKLDMSTGRILQILNIPRKYFAEGSCVLDNKIYLLTWNEHTCFVYDAGTFRQIGTFQYNTEGWGLTTDGQQLIMSDGSATIYFRNPNTFVEQRRITVRKGNQPVQYLNELEYINGEIWANVYTTDRIVRINPKSGEVTGEIDLTNLLPRNLHTAKTDVLNGIAYNSDNKRLVVTGKNWAKLYEITIIEKNNR